MSLSTHSGSWVSKRSKRRSSAGLLSLKTVSAIADGDRFAGPRENINLMAVIEAALVSCRDKAREAGVELAARYAADLPREYFTNQARFRHVLRDLADYAIVVSEQGRVLLSARKNSEFVELNLQVSEPRTEVKTEAGAVAKGGTPHAGDFARGRLEMIRENLKLLDGHVHYVKRPVRGIEIGICLAQGRR